MINNFKGENFIIKAEYTNDTGIRDVMFDIDIENSRYSLEYVLNNVNFKYYREIRHMICINDKDLHLFVFLNIPMLYINNYKYIRSNYDNNIDYSGKIKEITNEQLALLISIKYYSLAKGLRIEHISLLRYSLFEFIGNRVVTKEYISNNELFYKLVNILHTVKTNFTKEQIARISNLIYSDNLNEDILNLLSDNPKFWINNLYSLELVKDCDLFKRNCNYSEVEFISKLTSMPTEYSLRLYNTFGDYWLIYLKRTLSNKPWFYCKDNFINTLPIEGFVDKKIPALILSLNNLVPSALKSIIYFSNDLTINDKNCLETLLDSLNIQRNISSLGDTTLSTEETCNIPKETIEFSRYVLKLCDKNPASILKKYVEYSISSSSIGILTDDNIREMTISKNDKIIMSGIVYLNGERLYVVPIRTINFLSEDTIVGLLKQLNYKEIVFSDSNYNFYSTKNIRIKDNINVPDYLNRSNEWILI